MHQFVVSFTSHGGKGPPRLFENTGVHLAWIPYCSSEIVHVHYQQWGGRKLSNIRESWPKKFLWVTTILGPLLMLIFNKSADWTSGEMSVNKASDIWVKISTLCAVWFAFVTRLRNQGRENCHDWWGQCKSASLTVQDFQLQLCYGTVDFYTVDISV